MQDISVGSIRRLDGKREITISADALDSVDLGEVNASLEELWNDELAAEFPETSFAVGGEFSEFQDLLLDILRVFLLGIFLIYLILGTQFNSYKQPFLIIFAIPFAFVGVVLFLAVSGTPFSTTVLYAGVALAGIAVNDAIVLISFINELRKEQGLPVREAVLQAAGTRLRPIVLTLLTTIMGLLPTAIGIGGTSVVWGPMASTIIFGLIFSTMTALIIIPLLYGLFFDKKAKKGDGGESSAKPASGRPKRRGGVKKGLYHAKKLGTAETAFAGLLLGLGALVLSGLFSPGGFIHAETADDGAALPGSFVSGYPELYSFSEGRSREIDTSRLNVSDIENFLDEWAMNSAEQQAMSFTDMVAMLDATLDKGTPSLDQLESASRIQEAQVKNLEQSRFPNFSIVTDPAQTPLYSYSRIETAPPATSLVESHSFGAGLSASYDLPTAGNLSASLNQSTSFSHTDGGDWEWQQNPSLGLSFNQPLFQGPGVIRTDHAANTLEKAELDRTGTQKAYDTARSQLLLQGLRLFHMRQTFLENRWILQEQIELARNDLEQAKADLKRGVISSLQLRREELDFDELLLDLTDINKEISQVEISIEEIWNGDIRKILELLMMPDDRVTEFIQDGEFRLIENGELYNRVLKYDSDYQTALREKRKAELDKLLGSPADAPRLGLALNLSPQYPGGETGYSDLGESFTQLFSSDSNPTLSFSVTLQVPDLLRKQKEFTSAVQKEQMKQAEAKLAEAVLGVQETLRDLQARIRSQYLALAIVFEEFKIAEGDFQQEQRRLESGLSNQTLLRQRGLAAYRAAFQVMQSLRELSILSLELNLLQGGNF